MSRRKEMVAVDLILFIGVLKRIMSLQKYARIKTFSYFRCAITKLRQLPKMSDRSSRRSNAAMRKLVLYQRFFGDAR
jgi:hypothetical protein